MRVARDYLEGFVQLPKQTGAEERRALWRQSMATLAAAAADQRPAPLEGLAPDALLSGVRTALETKLIDDLGWLSRPAAAAAVYELAAALPPSAEKRELGRRVLGWLQDSDAATFVALATALAAGSRRGLSGPGVRARVALALDLPIGTGARADALALALVSRRDLVREWLAVPSTGSLPSRRLAARLLERAAREAARRSAQGDEGGVLVFEGVTLRDAWTRLLADREPLVWRHAATARGLLSAAAPMLREQIERDLDPALTPTEWRRASAALAASIALDPTAGVARVREVLEGEIPKRDPGVAAAMIFGLHRAAEAEPAAAESLLESLVRIGGTDAAEALVDLRRERLADDFGAWAASIARAQLRETPKAALADDGRAALHAALDEELAPDEERTRRTPRDLASSALVTFAEKSARDAMRAAETLLGALGDAVSSLERTKDDDAEGRKRTFRTLREIDQALFETATLVDLTALGPRGEADVPAAKLGDLFKRTTTWLLARETDPVATGGAIPHLTLRLRRLRTLLHLVDADSSYGDDRGGELRERRLAAVRVLLRRARYDAPSPLRRTVCAALARASDALVREEIFEVSDVLATACVHAPAEEDLRVLSEATLLPEFAAALAAQAHAAHVARSTGKNARDGIDAVLLAARSLPAASSPRVEALRTHLLAYARALEAVAGARSLKELGEQSNDGALPALESAAHGLALLVAGARRRVLGAGDDEPPATGAALRLVSLSVERASRGSRDALPDALTYACATLLDELLPAAGSIGGTILGAIQSLPATAPPRTRSSIPPGLRPAEPPLPAWLPPGRTLGGFYVLKALGAGAAGSVFIVKRSEERLDERAERFALKVPEYDGSAARTLSEAEFLQVFREEAGALLALPHQRNLAGFVTFDAGARPKPILVMELVQGPTLERVLESGDLDVKRALAYLDDVAAGLEAMHGAGLGHLDIKPSNVIIRESAGTTRPEAVLVDFGLAGRKIRAGCATAFYGAPEIWGLVPQGHEPRPAATDVYAFGCIVFEVLTGELLFSAPTEIALVTTHLSHDGTPEALAAFEAHPKLRALGRVLSIALRQDPRKRASIAEVRAALADLGPGLEGQRWPLRAE